ncbi:MAG: CoA transferase [Bacteriovorax sp.]|nr:CoA transferase [Rhizobacter sp.]
MNLTPAHEPQQPLKGLKVVEFEGLGPGPLAGRMLAQGGAEVTLVARPGGNTMASQFSGTDHPMRRGKQLLVIDLKSTAGVAQALALIAQADALIEGNRPGVMERLGLSPATCHAQNPRLVYGRMTGWGQRGPLANAAGHDLNYVALTGLLSLSARPGERPMLPPTVVGDGAGAVGLAYGIVCGVLQARFSGQGSVIDAAIIDMASALGGLAHWIHGSGGLGGEPGTPQRPSAFHDSPFYDVYACADGRFITVGALEPQFYALLLQKLEMTDVDPRAQYDSAAWPALKARFTALFLTRTRAQWCALLEGTDVCFAPVLTITEAAAHPHNLARGAFDVLPGGGVQAAPAPRFSASS